MTARAGVIGVTSVRSNTDFKVNRSSAVASLQLVDGVPVTATTVSVRFKKGDDVWELRVDPTAGNIIDLTVPNGETDRFRGRPSIGCFSLCSTLTATWWASGAGRSELLGSPFFSPADD